MYLIVGLGNYGLKYKNTRHNAGFDVIDLLSKEYNIKINRQKFKGEIGDGEIEGEKVILLKPLTYMNLSGESVREAASFYKIDPENIIVISDDISLNLGKIRIRQKGSAGGHNGLKNIILNISSQEFPRIKIGVGQDDTDLKSYVLGKFSKQDKEVIEEVYGVAIKAIVVIIKEGCMEAMNKYNGFNLQ
ncbi:MAG: aminoacyl-tRNA hydrolase [Clostridiaceae bacterium]